MPAMLRRSHRLEASEYYDPDGVPTVSYRETLARIFRRRRTRRRPSQPRGEIGQIETTSNRSGRTLPIEKLFGFLIFMMSFGLAHWSSTLRHSVDEGPWESPVSPIIIAKPPGDGYKGMERRLRDLQDELLRLKKQMNSVLPAADILPNFALESLGARVVLHLSSETYPTQEASHTLFGVPIRRPPVSPRTVIQGHSPLIPGRCWAFVGGQGHVVIALPYPVSINFVTLGHIVRNLSPTGTITSAPKEFSIHGMENLRDDGTQLGTFIYDQAGDPIQTFKIPDHKQGVFRYVKLQVESNWGHSDYSCLYSFRVHGKLAE